MVVPSFVVTWTEGVGTPVKLGTRKEETVIIRTRIRKIDPKSWKWKIY